MLLHHVQHHLQLRKPAYPTIIWTSLTHLHVEHKVKARLLQVVLCQVQFGCMCRDQVAVLQAYGSHGGWVPIYLTRQAALQL
jgi:hypothetical protein